MTIQNNWNNELRSPVMALGNDAVNDIYYNGVGNTLTRLPAGNPGDLLILRSGGPRWENTAPSLSGNAGGSLQGTYPNPTLAANVVGLNNLLTINQNQFFGRATAGSGNVELLTSAQVIASLGLGTAATTNTGTSSGNVPVIGAGNTLDASIIPRSALNNPEVVNDQAARLAVSGGINLVKQLDNGVTYGLRTGQNPTVDASWIPLGDTAIAGADITSGTIAPARLGANATSTRFLRGDSQFVDLPPSFTWETASASRTMEVNKGYIVSGVSRVDLALPTVAAVGDRMRIVGSSTAGWRMTQSGSQQTHYLTASTTSGDVGRIDSNNASATPPLASPRSCIELMCTVANTVFQVISSVGTVDVV